MFRFTKKPSSGSHNQYLAKNTGLVQRRYRRSTDVVSVMAALCLAVLTVDAGLLARSQDPEGPTTGYLDTGFFSWFRCVYKRMLRWLPSFQVATTCPPCSPPDLIS